MREAEARDRLIVALDVANIAEARQLIGALGEAVSFYKIGLELVSVGGFELARALKAQGKSVFLDMKLHDIPNTVERATINLAQMGVDLLTVHAYPQTMAAAARGRGAHTLRILGVTILTSMHQTDFAEAGYQGLIAQRVETRARQAMDAGIDGLVCAPQEASAVRQATGAKALIVTPGVRPAGSEHGDQARSATPTQAIQNGASHLVVGRPIIQAYDPLAAAQAIILEIAAAG